MSPEGGGPAEAIRRLAEIASAQGCFETEVSCLDDPRSPFLQREQFPVHAVGPGAGKYGYTNRLGGWLRGNLSRFDGVFVNGLWQYHSLGASRACRGRKPYFVFPHGMLDPWFKRAYPLKHIKKLAYWSMFEHRVLMGADRVLFTSTLEQDLARQSFRKGDWKGVVVPFGTVTPTFDRAEAIRSFLEICPAVKGRRFLLFLGRLHEKKGLDLLVEAFVRIAQSEATNHLVIAGPDQRGFQDTLKLMAERGGIKPRVHFTGMLEGAAKWGAICGADAFVLPSHQENFGIAVVEALACGTPVLISSQVNIWREIAEDRVGFVEHDTAEGVFNLLQRWNSCPDYERLEMRKRAQRCFSERFDLARTPKVLTELILESSERKHPAHLGVR